MKCDKLNHLLAEYVFDELDEKTAGEVSAHLRACPACREAADDMRRVAGLLREGAEARGTPTLSEERRRALFAAAGSAQANQGRFTLLRKAKSLATNRWALGVAALLAVCVLLAGALPTLTSLRPGREAVEVPSKAFDMVAPTPPVEPPPSPAPERTAPEFAKAEAPSREFDDLYAQPTPMRRERAVVDDLARAAPEEDRPLRGLREAARQREGRLEEAEPPREALARMQAARPGVGREDHAEALAMMRASPEPADLSAVGQWQATAAEPVSNVGLRSAVPPYLVARDAIERGHFPPQVALRPDELVGAFEEPLPTPDERPLAIETQAGPGPFDGGTAQLMINLRGSAVVSGTEVDVTFRPERVRRQRLVGQGLMHANNATVLFEIETDEPELRDFGEVRLRRVDAETQEIQEVTEPLPDTDVVELDPSEAPYFFLAVCSAEFAGILRGSEDARAAALDRLLPVLEKTVDALPRDSQAAELLETVRRARELAEP